MFAAGSERCGAQFGKLDGLFKKSDTPSENLNASLLLHAELIENAY